MDTRCRGTGREGSLLVREALVEDVIKVASDLRPEDVAEIVAATGFSALEGLELSHAMAAEAWYIETNDGTPIALGGARPDERDSPSACVWLVCTDAARSASIDLIRIIRDRVTTLGRAYGLLYGFVDARNALRQRWLRTLGFRVDRDHVQYGHLGLPFHQFVSAPKED